MPWKWTANYRNLRDVLARLYRRDADIERLLVDSESGIEPAFLEWHDKPVNTWHGIIRQAGNRGY